MEELGLPMELKLEELLELQILIIQKFLVILEVLHNP